ncbi:hypothetical protein QOZ84_03370 [Romboutsia sedimentorum]|uniref:Zinc ribbon domain-containing protein n=1 Tax=Romboutsia sedimentorum TaxID=1368474 RepID=A0ABT7E6M6_9FIRM|nr:hypothetical protein [Romboutsia sedimentorum]MDK2562577.1 hypothetical protein [Romboutsia sedimentorum]
MDNNKYKYKNYFKEDGRSVQKIENNKYTLKKLENSTCVICNKENNKQSSYCKHCGNNLSEVEENNLIKNEIKDSKSLKHILKNINFKKASITSLCSILILFIVALIFKLLMGLQIREIGMLINPIHIVMGLNLGHIDISSSGMLGSGGISAHLGILVFLIAPILALTISNLLFMKKENTDAKSTLLNSIGVGLTYGLMLFVLSIFTKIKTSPFDMMQYQMSFEVSYRSLNMFFNGFIIAFLCTYLIGFKKSYEKDNIHLGIMKKAISTVFLGYVVVFLILTAITLSDKSYLYEFGMYGYTKDISTSLVLTQLASYMWGFANFIPLTISSYTISIFNLLGSDLFLNTKLIFIAMVVLSSLIILVVGCNLKRKYKDDKKNVVLIFSLYYALFMGIVALFSSILIGGNISSIQISNYQGAISLGLPLISTIIRSFLYSYIVAGIGYKLYVFE